MNHARDLELRNRKYTILSIIFIAFDFSVHLLMQILDILFTINKGDSDDDYHIALFTILIQIFLVNGFLLFLSFVISFCQHKKALIIFNFFAYLILGVAYICYLLIAEIQILQQDGVHKSTQTRPVEFYEFHVDVILFACKFLILLLRTTGVICLVFLIKGMNQVDDAIKSQLEDLKQVDNVSFSHARSSTEYSEKSSRSPGCINNPPEKDSLLDPQKAQPGDESCRVSHTTDRSLSNGNKFCSEEYYKRILGNMN